MFVEDDAFAESRSRSAVWSDWNDALTVLRPAVTVHAAWIGGSFTTSKMDPGDIDVAYIINASDVRNPQGEQEKKIADSPGRPADSARRLTPRTRSSSATATG